MPHRTDAWERLAELFSCFPEPGRWLPLLKQHARLVAAERVAGRLTAVTGDDVVMRQYGESLELLRIAREHEHGTVIVDVGSGAGFPGLVVAAVEPASEVHLVEPLQKRAAFLERAAAVLGLAHVEVHARRAEDAGRGPLRGSADLVVARAVAPLRELLEYTAPLTRAGGLLALAKGSGARAEVAASGEAARQFGVTVHEPVPMREAVSATISVVLGRRIGALDEQYPRRAGVPGRRPL